ncbi:Endonuclease/exonuclease/phosphatase [Hysterangium stoloniferum]|nr:Endonuclease/exonuclease/phosphatase [Hysterangium stoloniferum]
MEKLQAIVSLSLRATESCTAAAEVQELTLDGSLKDSRRILAVITHIYPQSGNDGETTQRNAIEEGCLFLMKYKSWSSPEIYPQQLFPIDSDLVASLKQRSGSDDPEFELSLKARRLSTFLLSKDMTSLSSVLEETRRLKKQADPYSSLIAPTSPKTPSSRTNFQASLDHDSEEEDELEYHWKWLHFYLNHRFSRILSFALPKPRDIRYISNGYDLSPSSAGLPADEDGDIELIRDHWAHQQLIARKNEYSTRENYQLRIGTFNVNGKTPSQSLASWIWNDPKIIQTEIVGLSPSTPGSTTEHIYPHTEPNPISDAMPPTADSPFLKPNAPVLSAATSVHSLDDNEKLPDILVLGFQELDLSAEALLYSTSTAKADVWISAVFTALGKAADNYTKLLSKQLVGVLILVIVRKDIQASIKEVSATTAAVGIMGFMGNKGAAAVRLCLNSTVITFVCSHLAAFDDLVEKRNSDFNDLARKLEFPTTWRGTRGMKVLNANIWETDMLFWLGGEAPATYYNEIRSFLTNEPPELNLLLRYDQLKTAAEHKRAFVNFTEHVIDFAPTYRFGEPAKDSLGYDVKRKPAWTDRILHLCSDAGSVFQKTYRSCTTITLSDHRPVVADFDISVDNNDEKVYYRTMKSIFNDLGELEDSEKPIVVLVDGPEVNIGEVCYARSTTRSFRVKNEGAVRTTQQDDDLSITPFRMLAPFASYHWNQAGKEWMQLQPTSGILCPGETMSIELSIYIDMRFASFFNLGSYRLTDYLVLHLAKGTDHIISVVGTYQRTCFANSLAWLVRSPGPIRSHSDVPLLPEANTLSAPREFMFLVEWLMTNAVDVLNLFITPADPNLVFIIREYLDTQTLDSGNGVAFPADTNALDIAQAYGETLVEFLCSLTEPVIPWAMHPRCALARDREHILDDIPGFARNVYVTVTAFLHYVVSTGGAERSTALARVFADVLLRDNPKAPPGIPVLTPLQKRQFVLYSII